MRPGAAAFGGDPDLDLPAVVAQHETVAAQRRHVAERTDVRHRFEVCGDGDSARRILDHQRFGEFAVAVVRRDVALHRDLRVTTTLFLPSQSDLR